jgi:NTE family protein
MKKMVFKKLHIHRYLSSLDFFRFIAITIACVLLQNSALLAQEKYRTDYKKKPKVGLVLSGGGAKGYAHIGALKVIRDAGIEVDYISGTSMGSIVGGLYAIGYSPEFIEELVQTQNWNHLLLDKIDRRNLSIDQKAFNEQQFISFPVTREDAISLPFGIKNGQNITALLSYLVSPVFQYHHFNEFQTPFLCIATDIANGESVVLDQGNLADAMRASMAIPTVFTPVVIDGRLLVDGGLVNNFPAKELAERGCDIIIGVDVQKDKDFNVEDLNSITAILDRSAGFYRKALNDTAAKYVDFYIHPDISGYSVSSFEDFDSIIGKGRQAAMKQYNELEKLGKYLSTFPDYERKIRDLSPLNSFVMDTLIIQSNNLAYIYPIEKTLGFSQGDIINIRELNNAIQKIYGTLFFKTVSYEIEPAEKGTALIIRAQDEDFGSIGLGVHYDSDYKAGLLLTGNFRNVLIKNTLLETTLGFSENPHISLKYYQNRGMLPGFGFKALWSSFSFIDYLNGKDKLGVFRMSNLNVDLYTHSINKQSLAFGGGVQLELTSLRNDVGLDLGINNSTYSQTYFNFFSFLKYDNWDHSFFPHQGAKGNVKAIFITKWLTGGNLNLGKTATVLSGAYDVAVPLSAKWTLRTRINAGLTFGEGYYFSQLFIMGGQGSHYLPGMISFMGLDVAQLSNRQMVAARLRLQYHIFKKHYILLTGDVSNLSYSKNELFVFDYGAVGYGATWGYDSLIGPVEFSVMGSNYRNISAYLSLGFWF